MKEWQQLPPKDTDVPLPNKEGGKVENVRQKEFYIAEKFFICGLRY